MATHTLIILSAELLTVIKLNLPGIGTWSLDFGKAEITLFRFLDRKSFALIRYLVSLIQLLFNL